MSGLADGQCDVAEAGRGRGALLEVREALEPDAVVVSVAAGVTTSTMEALVPNAVARAMPNTLAASPRLGVIDTSNKGSLARRPAASSAPATG